MGEPLLKAVGVRKNYGHTEVLRGIDLAVHRGQVVCLLGPSGSGKSTFLRCINHLEPIDGGQIWVDTDVAAGTTIRFTIPKPAPDAADEGPSATATPVADLGLPPAPVGSDLTTTLEGNER